MATVMLLRITNAAYELLLSAPAADAFDSLLTWLTARDISFVAAVPAQNGMFCTQEAPLMYRVFQSVWVPTDNMFVPTLIYTLQWLPWLPAQRAGMEVWEQIPADEK